MQGNIQRQHRLRVGVVPEERFIGEGGEAHCQCQALSSRQANPVLRRVPAKRLPCACNDFVRARSWLRPQARRSRRVLAVIARCRRQSWYSSLICASINSRMVFGF